MQTKMPQWFRERLGYSEVGKLGKNFSEEGSGVGKQRMPNADGGAGKDSVGVRETASTKGKG